MRDFEKEIAQKKAELQLLEGLSKHQRVGLMRSEAVKRISEFTLEEKEVWFETIYNEVNATLLQMEEGTWHEDNDDGQYLWETCWGVLAKDKNKFKQYVKNLLSE